MAITTAKRRVIKNLKLNAIANDVAKTEGWSAKDKTEAVRGYRAYLSMRLQRGNRRFLAIDGRADKIWHAHIVNTVQYRTDCKRVFGRFLDHTPLPHPKLTAPQKVQFAKDAADYTVECKTWSLIRPYSIWICI